MRLLVSCIPYDGGKSGISVYTREVVRALRGQGHDLTLLVEPGVDCGQILQDAAVRSVSAPRDTGRPAISMLWHLFVLPFWILRHCRDKMINDR